MKLSNVYLENIQKIHEGLCKAGVKDTDGFAPYSNKFSDVAKIMNEIFKTDLETTPKIIENNDFWVPSGKELYSGTRNYNENCQAILCPTKWRKYSDGAAEPYWFSPKMEFALHYAKHLNTENVIIAKQSPNCKIMNAETLNELSVGKYDKIDKYVSDSSITPSDNMKKIDEIATRLFMDFHFKSYLVLAHDYDGVEYNKEQIIFARRKNLILPKTMKASQFYGKFDKYDKAKMI